VSHFCSQLAHQLRNYPPSGPSRFAFVSPSRFPGFPLHCLACPLSHRSCCSWYLVRLPSSRRVSIRLACVPARPHRFLHIESACSSPYLIRLTLVASIVPRRLAFVFLSSSVAARPPLYPVSPSPPCPTADGNWYVDRMKSISLRVAFVGLHFLRIAPSATCFRVAFVASCRLPLVVFPSPLCGPMTPKFRRGSVYS
jgi:hypothetical protein